MSAKVVFVDLDGVLADFERALLACDGDKTKIDFSTIPPIPNAIESFRELTRMFDVYILSTAPWSNPKAWGQKVEWVREHLGGCAEKRLILTHHKNLLRGDYLIDDRLVHGADHFEGGFIQFGSTKFPDWESIMLQLKSVSQDV